MMPDTVQLNCLSWNVHRCRGNDGVVDPARTLDVLLSEVVAGNSPDIMFLQEADEETPPHRGLLDLRRLEEGSGLRHRHADVAMRWGEESHGFHGVIAFLHPSIVVEDMALLDLPGHCHRGAVIIDARRADASFRLVGTHLSRAQALRMMQLRAVGQHLSRRSTRQTILIGDLNEWRPWSGMALSPRVVGLRLTGPAPATFPIRRPFLPLDRVLTTPEGSVTEARVLDGPGIRMASDHRPLAASVSLAV
jgi:endonuclease/exonuclease/phosphatase family metal-dependent hydrolase